MASSNVGVIVTLSSDEEMGEDLKDSSKMEEVMMKSMGLPLGFRSNWDKQEPAKVVTDSKVELLALHHHLPSSDQLERGGDQQ